MAIIPSSVTLTRVGPMQFRFSFLSDLASAIYYLWLNGEFLTETRETTFDITVPLGGQFQFSVFDDPDDRPPVYLKPTMTLRWDGDPDTVMFRVEQLIDGDWKPVNMVYADDTRVFHYESGVLADSTYHQFKIIALDAEGRASTALELGAEMCRYPDEPTLTPSISGGEIVIE